MKRIARIIIFVLISLHVSACGVVIVGGAAAGGISVLADRRSPSVQAIDLGIELELGSQLSKKLGDSAHIVVVSFNQKVLLLGEAKDEAIKAQAETEAKVNKNVRILFNELVIGPNSSLATRANDSYLASKIKTQMVFTSELPSNSMSISVENDRAYLMGILTQAEAEKAKKVASTTNGVKQVFAYFDIISDEERVRLEKQGKAQRSQPL